MSNQSGLTFTHCAVTAAPAEPGQYHAHTRPPEVVVAGKEDKVVTARESIDDLLRNERIVSFSLT